MPYKKKSQQVQATKAQEGRALKQLKMYTDSEGEVLGVEVTSCRMYHWMDAYRNGLSACDAQFKVKQFSSKKYSSHQRVPESLTREFD